MLEEAETLVCSINHDSNLTKAVYWEVFFQLLDMGIFKCRSFMEENILLLGRLRFVLGFYIG